MVLGMYVYRVMYTCWIADRNDNVPSFSALVRQARIEKTRVGKANRSSALLHGAPCEVR